MGVEIFNIFLIGMCSMKQKNLRVWSALWSRACSCPFADPWSALERKLMDLAMTQMCDSWFNLKKEWKKPISSDFFLSFVIKPYDVHSWTIPICYPVTSSLHGRKEKKRCQIRYLWVCDKSPLPLFPRVERHWENVAFHVSSWYVSLTPHCSLLLTL